MMLLTMTLLTQVGRGQSTLLNYSFEGSGLTGSSNVTSLSGVNPTLTGSASVSFFAGSTTSSVASACFASANGKYFELTLTTTGYSNLIIKWNARTSSATSSWVVTADDGGGYGSAIATHTLSTSFTAATPLALSSSFSDKSSIKIRWTASVSAAQTIRLDDIVITGTSLAGTPAIATSSSSISGFSAIIGNPSTEQTYTVSGSDLTSDITLTAPTGYEISETSGSGFASSLNLTPTSGTVSATPIYVRLSSSASVGVTSGDITHSSSGATTQTVSLSGNVYNVEPSDHVTSFACGATGSSTIPLSWVDASGSVTPDGYLIKWSNVSFADIVDPLDGTSESNGAGKRNVAFGAQAVTISGLVQTSNYYFKIYPYTNSGANIDYKTDGTIPQTNCSTIAGPWENFEIGSKTGYAIGSVTCSAGDWLMDDALLGGSAEDRVRDFKSVRLRNSGSITMNFNVTNGIGLLRLYHGVYGTDPVSTSSFVVEASTDNGISWGAYVSPTITSSSTTLSQQSFLVNLTGSVRFRIRKTSGGSTDRINIDDITFTENASPLPVSLLSFSGYKDGVRNQLRWVTTTETNNSGFQVERSSDGLNYQSIGFVGSLSINGNSQTQLKYNFVDASPTGIKQYYRLKQMDIDGRSTLSNILLIQGEKPTAFEIASVFPNPSRGQVTMLLCAPANETVSIRLMDLAGRILETRQVNVLAGNNSIPFDLSKQAKGQYLISVGGKSVRVVRE